MDTRSHAGPYFALLICLGTAFAADRDPIAEISTYSTAQLASMEDARRNTPSTGTYFVSAEIVERSFEYGAMLRKDGIAKPAEQLLAAYRTEHASRDLAAVAFHFLREAEYPYKLQTGDRGLDRKAGAGKNAADPAKLAQLAMPLVEELAKRDDPLADSVASELLLQLVCEGLPSQHTAISNGGRPVPEMPEELMRSAAGFLNHDDPFVRAMAEWTISTKICNDLDNRGKHTKWPGRNPPAWIEQWLAVPAAEHLAMDYARQAITLGVHRRSDDLVKLARDLMRRAEAKANWAEADDGPRKTMKSAFSKLNPNGDLTTQRKAWLTWRQALRPVVLGTRDIDFEQIVYLKRFSGGHHIQPTIHMNNYPPGGDIFVQTGLDPTAPTRALIGKKLDNGYVQDLDLWYDADRIVFSRTIGDGRAPQQLYEIGIDGTKLRKLTDSRHHDVDPCYLPDGSVVFGSTRAEAGVMCGGGSYSQNNVYRLMPDGKEILRLTYSPDDDAYPHVLNDGRVVYMRWDYQERGVDEIFALWAVRPDGSGNDGFYRVHIPDTQIIQALKDARPIPGTQKLVAMGSSHRGGNEGTVVVCDTTMGINEPRGIRNVTPYHSPIGRGKGKLMRPVTEGGVPYVGGFYVKPVPITEKTFLVSASYDMPRSCNYAVYYIDVWGNKELLHRDKLMEAVAVMPVRPRKKPPVIPNSRRPETPYATCYVENVYNDLPGVETGEVKYLRILEQLFWISSGKESPVLFQGSFTTSGGTGQGATRIIGTVPVEADGSASFQVPSDMPVCFQALDKDFRAIQRMRTHVEFAPGEIRGCIGCHETRGDVVRTRPKGTALNKAPIRPTPPPWGHSTFIGFEEHIQPVFEKKCVSCHSGNVPKGKLLLTAKRDKQGYMQSYRSLFGLKPGQSFPTNKTKKNDRPDGPTWEIMTGKVAHFLGETLGEVTRPYQFGSPQAPLGRKLASDPEHRKILSNEEMQLLMAWLDVRAPYKNTYHQKQGRKYVTIEVKPCEPFAQSREHELIKLK